MIKFKNVARIHNNTKGLWRPNSYKLMFYLYKNYSTHKNILALIILKYWK